MSTSRNDDPNKPVTGYPYQPAQSSYNPNGGGYPRVQNNYHQSHPGTGYPYTAPPPAAFYNPHAYPAEPYDPRRAIFFRRVIIAMIAVFIIFGAITFIVWLVLRPHLPEFRVDSASVSGFNASASQLTANWDVGLFVRNPNKKMTVAYNHVEASVFYRNEFLIETAVAPFAQEKGNETTVRVKFAASGTYVDDSSISRMAGERSRGTVNFNLRLLGWVRFNSGAWRTRMHLIKVICEDVTIGFSSNSGAGTLSGGPKKCEVDL